MSVNITPFGILPDGDEARCVALSGGGLEAEVLTYGGALRAVAPGAAGRGAGL